MAIFRTYGIALQSDVPIPGLQAVTSRVAGDTFVQLFLGRFPQWFHTCKATILTQPALYCSKDNDQGEPLFRVWQVQQGQYLYFRYAEGVEFLIDPQGLAIWAIWANTLTLEDTATFLLGPILGFFLRIRGTVCLHASAVAIQDKVAVFVGEAGAGKSTLAAAFAQRGYAILAEDVVALIDQDDFFLVQPAYPCIRLWDASVQALFGAHDVLPRLVPTHPNWDKRYLDLQQPSYRFQQNPLQLAAIYCINPRSQELNCPHIRSLAPTEQLITLVASTYASALLDKSQRAQEFEVLGRLVTSVPIRQLTPHLDLKRLPLLLDTILEDFAVTSAHQVMMV